MDEPGLLERHARLLFDVDDGRIGAVNEPEAEPPPRLWVARGRTATLVLARADVTGPMVERAASLCREAGPWDGRTGTSHLLASLAGLLAGTDGPADATAGPAFTFGEQTATPTVEGLIVVDPSTAPLLERHFPFTRRHLAVRSPVAGVVQDGAVVAICMACRTRPDAGEAGLFTVESARGQGFARALVPAWRAALEAAGRTPFYSTTWDNAASLAVARGLALEPFAEEIAIL